MTDQDQDLRDNDPSPASPASKRLPWISITALAFALLAVITYGAMPKIVQAVTPQPASSQSAATPQPAPPSPASSGPDQTQSDQGEGDVQTDHASDEDKPSWRERGADLLKRAAEHLEEDNEPGAEQDRTASKTSGQATGNSANDGLHFSTENGSFQFTIGNTPAAIPLQTTRPAWVDHLELGLLLGSLIASGVAILIGLTAFFTAEPLWLGLCAMGLGGTVIIAYIVALVATILMGLVAIIILGIILSALVGAGGI